MGYAEELQVLDQDIATLAAEKEKKQPASARKLEKKKLLTRRDLAQEKEPAESAAAFSYGIWKKKILADTTYHPIAKLVVTGLQRVIAEYRTLLETGSQTEDKKELRGIAKRLKELKKRAQAEIKEALKRIDEDIERAAA